MALVLAAVAMLGLVACGGGGGSKKAVTVTQAEVQSATNVVQDTGKLSNLKTDTKSDDTFTALGQIFGNASQLWGKAQQETSGTALLADFDIVGGGLTDTCVSTSGGTTTYSNCSNGAQTIDGTVTINGDSIVVDLTIVTTGGGTGDQTFTWSGDVTVANNTAGQTTIDGWLKFSVETNQGGSSVTYDVSIDYVGILMGNTGCPTAGTMSIDVSVDMPNVPSGYAPDFPSVEITFGPACGDVAMTAS